MTDKPLNFLEAAVARHSERLDAIENATKAVREDAKEGLKDAIDYNKRTITVIGTLFALFGVLVTALSGFLLVRYDNLRTDFDTLTERLNKHVEERLLEGEERISRALGESKSRGLVLIEGTDVSGAAITTISLYELDNGSTQIGLRTHYRVTTAGDQAASGEGVLVYYEGDEFIDLMKQSIGFANEEAVLQLTEPSRTVESPVLITKQYPGRGSFRLSTDYFDCDFAFRKADALLTLTTPTYIHVRPILPDYDGTPPYYKLPLKFVRGYEPDFCQRATTRAKP